MLDHTLRKLGIGGSEVGAILGVDEYRDAFSVWADKKGGLERSEPSPRMIVGKALEEGVLKLYTHVTHRKITYCDVTSRHPERPWQVYTPDALVVGERRGVDAKVVFWDQRRKWGHSASDIPDSVQLQALWYLSAMDYDAWDICAMVGEDMPRVYTITRDRERERVILSKCEEFYRRYLEGDETPPYGSSEVAGRWLQHRHPSQTLPLRTATQDEILALEEYAGVRAELKELDRQKKKYEIELKAAIGDAEGLEWERGRLTWRLPKKEQEPVTEIDWESLAVGLLQYHVKDEQARADLKATYTYQKTPKAKVRRFLLQYDGLSDEGADA